MIYANFESILETLGRQVKQNTYYQQHKVFGAEAILCSTLGQYNQLTVMKVGENALAEFPDMLIKWEKAIVEELRTNRPMMRISSLKQEYENATECYICRHEFEVDDPKGPKVRDHDHITRFFLGASHRQCKLERPVIFRIPVFFHNFCGYDAHLIVHEFCKRPDREIKVIGQNMEKYLQVGARKTWFSATRSNSYLHPWSNSRHRSPRPAVETFTILTRWSRNFSPVRTLNYSSGRVSSATTTSTLSCGSMNPLFLHERPSSISSEE